jgi:hypothetical protein
MIGAMLAGTIMRDAAERQGLFLKRHIRSLFLTRFLHANRDPLRSKTL